MVSESNSLEALDKKHECTEEEEEIASLVAGLTPPLAKEICKFFEKLREEQTEKEAKKLNKIAAEYFTRTIGLRSAFEQVIILTI